MRGAWITGFSAVLVARAGESRHTHAHTRTRTHIRTHTHAHTYAHTHTHTRARTHTPQRGSVETSAWTCDVENTNHVQKNTDLCTLNVVATSLYGRRYRLSARTALQPQNHCEDGAAASESLRGRRCNLRIRARTALWLCCALDGRV